MKKIYLIRHCETEANSVGQFRGRIDFDLSQRGREQAENLNDYFSTREVELIFSSPLKRALLTAQLTFPTKEIISDELINNFDLGSWSGRKKTEIKLEHPELYQRWLIEPEKIVFPGGESFQESEQRIRKFIHKLLQADAETIAVVSHRSVLKIILAQALDLRAPYFWKFHLDPASISLLFYSQQRGFILYQSNYIEHLIDFSREWE